MRRSLFLAGLAAVVALAAAPPRVSAHEGRPDRDAPGSLVGVSVEVDGRWVPLYRAPDGSGRYYVEARRGARYAIRLDNRSHERLGVALTVDGLNVISGQKAAGPGPGRMYVLDPWDSTEVQGWRTDLDSVQRFTFVDEARSYAVRSGKANSKMGWIEVAVFRERRPYAHREREITPARPGYEGRDQGRADGRADGAEPEAEKSARASGGAADAAPPAVMAKPAPADRAEGSRSFPGTGWGPRADDPAVVVQFDAQPHPAERITVRYEYAPALRALGILPDRWPPRDRLWERENAREGFAQPPRR
jgi:hypothetical protein